MCIIVVIIRVPDIGPAARPYRDATEPATAFCCRLRLPQRLQPPDPAVPDSAPPSVPLPQFCSSTCPEACLAHIHEHTRERQFVPKIRLRGTAGAAGLFTAGGLLTACGGIKESSAQTDTVLRIGYVSPSTGPAAGFGEPNAYLLKKLRATFADGLKIGGKKY